MTVEADARAVPRHPLSRDRVLRAAIDLADAGGIGSLTMRRLAQALGVEAMTIYYYVANKDELLNAAVDLVLSEVELPTPGGDWKAELRKTAISAHDVLVRHAWASGRMLSSGLTPSRLAYMESILATLRAGGFSSWHTHLAYHALESHIVGFTLWIAGMALPDDLTEVATNVLREVPAEDYPAFIEHIHEHLKPRAGDEEGTVEFGLDLILDGLERMLTSPRARHAGLGDRKEAGPGTRRRRR